MSSLLVAGPRPRDTAYKVAGESRSSQLGLEVGLPPRFTPAPELPEPSALAILMVLSLGGAWSHLSV